ncbi:MAG: twin-arginine translocation signal domain-containing protein, partial [Anaerolineae bacterium]|nr:twin-arginine translocation signal domain-containing protein [Anaerolineae bacterium]
MSKQLTRREFLRLSTIVTASAVAAACAPSKAKPTAAPAPTKAAPTATPAPTKAAPTPTPAPTAAPEVKLQGPIPYPPSKPMPGGQEAKKYNLDELLQYKSLPEYHQPEWMDKLVEDGTIPPVEERLPKEPQVIPKA